MKVTQTKPEQGSSLDRPRLALVLSWSRAAETRKMVIYA